MSIIIFNTLITDHAIVRFHQRAEDKDVKLFLKHMRDHYCVIVYECVKDGNLNGIAKRCIFGKSKFFITFDECRKIIVLKTII